MAVPLGTSCPLSGTYGPAYTHTHTHIYIYIYIYIYIIYVFICLFVYVSKYLCTYIFIYTKICMYMLHSLALGRGLFRWKAAILCQHLHDQPCTQALEDDSSTYSATNWSVHPEPTSPNLVLRMSKYSKYGCLGATAKNA